MFAAQRLRMKQRRRAQGTVAANGSAPESSAVKTGQATVLVIDDSDAMVEVLTDLLQHFDCKVISALNGRDGLATYEQNRNEVALVIVDMNMPVMDGAAVLDRLRQINATVPVIVSSSISEAEARRRCQEAGQEISHFLAKPYTLEQAREMVGAILNR